jgi:hypothetical protein
MTTGYRVIPATDLPLFHLAIPREGEPGEEALLLPHRDDAPLGYCSRIAFLFPNETYARPAQFGSIYPVPDESGTARVLLRRNAHRFVPSRVRLSRNLNRQILHRYRHQILLISARHPPASVEALRATHLFTSACFFHIRRSFRIPHSHVTHLTSWIRGDEPRWLPTRQRPIQSGLGLGR